MKIVVQRVKEACVVVNNIEISRINEGLCLFVGFCLSDNESVIQTMAKKIARLRIFEDENGKMNHDIFCKSKNVLSVSQFTLYADTSKGNRPSFTNAMPAQNAVHLFEMFNLALNQQGLNVVTGLFREEMQVHLINDGPVTILLEETHGKNT